MKFDQFIVKYLRRNGNICTQIHGWYYSDYGKLAELTKYVDFSCDFDTNGSCKKYRYLGAKGSRGCCCGGCRNCAGYLKILPANLELLNEYARLFDDEKYGYWREGTGCILPRSMRSGLCLTYNCNPNRYKFSAASQLFTILRNDKDKVVIDNVRYTDIDSIIDKLKPMLKKEEEQHHEETRCS